MFDRLKLIVCWSLLAAGWLIPGPAYAMHVSEGILPLPWAALWFVLSIPFIVLGLRDLQVRQEREPYFKPLVGLVGAAVFVISCTPIPVPIAGTCSHPCGTGMAAILIGPLLSVVVASVALVLQAVFLGHGGLTTLGANLFAIGVAGSFVGYGVFRLTRLLGGSWVVAAFVAGLTADWATYAATSLTLATALHGEGSFWTMFGTILLAFVPTQVPLGILEGSITAGAVAFVRSRRPEFLGLVQEGRVR